MSDSSTAIACFNNKGGIKIKKCNEIAKEIWLQFFKNNSFISSAQVPGKHNIETVIQNGNLILRYFFEITNKFPYPETDPFATRTSKLCLLVL